MFNSKIGIGILKHPGYNGKGGGGGGQTASTSEAKDFFGVGTRAKYENLLWNYISGDPATIDSMKNSTGFQRGLDTGREAVNRSFASTGFGPSGYQNIALQNFGNDYFQNYRNSMISGLTAPSGAGLSLGNTTTSTGTQQGNASPIWSLAGTLGSAAIFKSDRNVKTNIEHIDTIKGIKIYSFNYIWSKIKSIGVMAQDLLEMPEYKDAVHMTNTGYVVDYSKLPI
jgi:hypothetical protein